ncbi:pyridoxamine 5'-phosphate oxidase [Arthrobacter sp. SW1]|uniref:pyridoxamine 5'-phosphate oxidase family protein n=1 Tax=Arthrobacter sp. SW1 TaxID=1920889 RepID=UPI000877E4EB|nr:pyridoxamine 5'-phosphate oxidase family protein [Arthrobacter sp. SW1]OFI37975.1 pyridoxamine 5'-phosphate oxidase [Arthrobacter sp. SW1]
MGKVHESINQKLRTFIERQPLFFVATAPLSAGGHVNVSPRGLPGTFAVLDERTFAWLDVTGSGSETIAHLRENGRITVMFCAFDGPPNIVRLHGRGRTVTRYDDGFTQLAARFEQQPGTRAVIVVDVERVSDSCGWGVPLMSFEGHRELLGPFFERKGDDGSAAYRVGKNRRSIDGMPAYDYDPVGTGTETGAGAAGSA